MAGTGFHPEGHKVKPYKHGPGSLCPGRRPLLMDVHVICETCAEVCPRPGSECVDDC